MLKRKKPKMIDCESCDEPFKRGTGHLCWCGECSRPHPMCNDCYKEGKKQGNIIDKPRLRNFISEKNMEKYTC